MLRFRHISALVALTVTGALAGACGTEDDAASSASAETTNDAKFGPELFRNDFATYLKDDLGKNDDAITKLVYLPTEDVLTPEAGGTGAKHRAALDTKFKKILPSKLYANGANLDAHPLVHKDGLEDILKEQDVHIVIVPGIFGEFIPRTPFDELFSGPSAKRTEWEAKSNECTSATDPAKNKPAFAKGDTTKAGCDLRYNVKELRQEWHPLAEANNQGLIRVASLDDKNGKPLATVSYLRAGIGSLEDFGELADDNEVYLRRLDAYFKAIGGAPKNLYIMGYSRGTATGLDLVVRARAAADKHPWADNIKGFIAHAGVIYGSQLADASFKAGSPGKAQLDLLREFVGENDAQGQLTSCDGKTQAERASATASSDLMKKNLAAYGTLATSFGEVIAKSLVPSTFKELDEKFDFEKAKLAEKGLFGYLARPTPVAAKFGAFAARVLGVPIPAAIGATMDIPNGLPANIHEGVVDISQMIKGTSDAIYCKNIEAFKETARAIVNGARTLTTDSRDKWWKANTVPAGVKYYAITGTMYDSGNKEMSTNKQAYDPKSVDFQSLRGNFYDLLAASGTQLQDSQVPVQRGRFWPALLDPRTGFNPNQTHVETYFLGTVGVHHWGLGFPRAFSTDDVLGANPFPRTTLLKSIATFVAQVQAADTKTRSSR
jgi:hypothetical protein